LASAPNPEFIKISDYEYDGVVTLALVLGLDRTLKPALSAIGSLRNRFAHNLNMTLTVHDANNLYGTLSADLKSDAHEGYAQLLKRPQYAHWPKSMKGLAPNKLFGICVVELHQAITLETLAFYAARFEVEREEKKET
jgi:hypothetical protein